MKAHIHLVLLFTHVYLCAAILLTPVRVSSSLTNHSLADLSSSSTNISAPNRLPYSVRIPHPGNPFWLHLGFVPNKPMSQFDIGGILALSNHTVQEQIDIQGAQAIIPPFPGDERANFIEATEPGFLVFALFALEGGTFDFTWGLVQGVIEALYRFLIEGRRYNAVIYKVTRHRFGSWARANGRLDIREPPTEVS